MAEQQPNYTPICCETALNKLKRRIPYGWDLNAYRGCAHGCRYCYALGSHKYMDSADFHGDIYYKENIVAQLERELSSPGWQREVVNLGGVTDSYQPCEAQFQLLPDILKLLIRYKTPAIISTKSDLPLRDFDLIDELSRITYINIAASIVTVDEAVRQKLEPGSVSAERRFAMLKEFRKTNASTGLHCMPIIPYLTDGEENLDALFAQAADAGVDYVLPGTLYLRGSTKPAFLSFMEHAFPAEYAALLELYPKGSASKEYKESLYVRVNRLRAKYSLSSSYSKPMKEKLAQADGTQLSFDV